MSRYMWISSFSLLVLSTWINRRVGSAVMGVFLRFEDDSVESAKQAMQWNVKIINVSEPFVQYLGSDFVVFE